LRPSTANNRAETAQAVSLENVKLDNASARGGRDLCSRQIQLLSETDGRADVDVSLLPQAGGRSGSHFSDLGQSSPASIQLRINNGSSDKSARNTIRTAREVVTKATDTSRTCVLNHQHAAASFTNQLTQARENVQRKVCNDDVTPAYLPVFMDRKSREVRSVSHGYASCLRCLLMLTCYVSSAPNMPYFLHIK
jgi:hypothetical protein